MQHSINELTKTKIIVDDINYTVHAKDIIDKTHVNLLEKTNTLVSSIALLSSLIPLC